MGKPKGLALDLAKQLEIVRRQGLVERFLLQSMTTREIAVALSKADPPIVNDKGAPFSHTTVENDAKQIIALWKERNAEEVDARKAKILHELDEVKRNGWKAKDMGTVLAAIDKEARIIGVYAPEKHEHTGKDGAPIVILHEEGSGDAEPPGKD